MNKLVIFLLLVIFFLIIILIKKWKCPERTCPESPTKDDKDIPKDDDKNKPKDDDEDKPVDIPDILPLVKPAPVTGTSLENGFYLSNGSSIKSQWKYLKRATEDYACDYYYDGVLEITQNQLILTLNEWACSIEYAKPKTVKRVLNNIMYLCNLNGAIYLISTANRFACIKKILNNNISLFIGNVGTVDEIKELSTYNLSFKTDDNLFYAFNVWNKIMPSGCKFI